MTIALFCALSSARQEGVNIFAIISQANQLLESLRGMLSDLTEMEFFVRLAKIREFFVVLSSNFLLHHKEAYDTHLARAQRIRKEWQEEGNPSSV
jgi:hypothetical protein